MEKKFSTEINWARNTINVLAYLLNKMVKDQINYLNLLGETDNMNFKGQIR